MDIFTYKNYTFYIEISDFMIPIGGPSGYRFEAKVVKIVDKNKNNCTLQGWECINWGKNGEEALANTIETIKQKIN